MNDNPSHDPSPLDAYLDGALSPDECVAFEAQLAEDPVLREEMLLQSELEASLRRSFAPPAPAELTATTLAAASSNGQATGLGGTGAAAVAAQAPGLLARIYVIAHAPLKISHVAAAAAGLAVVGSLVWAMIPQQADRRPYGGHHTAKMQAESVPWAMDDLYLAFAERDLLPAWPAQPQEFAAATRDQLGEPVTYILPRGTQPRARIAAVAHANVVTPMSIALLGRVEGQPVVVVVDRLDRDGGQTLPEGSRLHLHRRDLGGLVLYEISPLPEAGLLPHFHAAE